MIKRIGFVLFGMLLTVSPIIHFTTSIPTTYWGQPVSPIGEVAFFCFGMAIILMSIFKPNSLIKKRYICPKCENAVEVVESRLKKCSKCHVDMVELQGFYGKNTQ